MSAFKFDFDLDDAEDIDVGGPSSAPEPAATPIQQEPFVEIPLDDLLAALPPVISYSPLSISLPGGRTLILPRRDLFDARFQLIAAGDAPPPAFLDAPSDLIPGVYEGGLKTWECALDLAATLTADDVLLTGSHTLEVGCGTAVPTLALLHALLSAAPNPDKPTHLHLQDYNAAVLALVTLPNLLLTWYTSPAAEAVRAAHAETEEPGTLACTPALIEAFRAVLAAHGVALRFFAGAWSLFDVPAPPPYARVLTAETVYAAAGLPALVALLRRACAPGARCLVAAKVLYFGVGGGVAAFESAVAEAGGRVRVVHATTTGVERRVLSVEWD